MASNSLFVDFMFKIFLRQSSCRLTLEKLFFVDLCSFVRDANSLFREVVMVATRENAHNLFMLMLGGKVSSLERHHFSDLEFANSRRDKQNFLKS